MDAIKWEWFGHFMQANFISIQTHSLPHILTMRKFPFPLPPPPEHLQSTCNIITSWMRDVKGADAQQVALVLAFLNEDYLRSVPLPRGKFFARTPSGCRHWFRVFTAWVLRWTSRRDEGTPDGFPDELNYHLRHHVYPDVSNHHPLFTDSPPIIAEAYEGKRPCPFLISLSCGSTLRKVPKHLLGSIQLLNICLYALSLPPQQILPYKLSEFSPTAKYVNWT